MLRKKITPVNINVQTPKKFTHRTTKRGKSQDSENGSSPEKRECPFSPSTIAANQLSRLALSASKQTPQERGASSVRSKSASRISRNLYNNNEIKLIEPPLSRGRGRPRKHPPTTMLKIMPGTDHNLEMEYEENMENIPPEPKKEVRRSVGRPRKYLKEPVKEEPKLEINKEEKMEVDETSFPLPSSSTTKYLKIQPIILKRVDLKTYRISNTPRNQFKTNRRSTVGHIARIFDSDYEESSSSSESEDSGSESDASSLSRSSTPVKRERFCRDGKSIKEIAKSVQRKNFQGIPKTLEDLRSILHTSEIPDKMPCREEEFEVIRRFVVEGVKGSFTSQAMYISGVPGTGKTATTQAVIKEVAKKYSFDYVAVNAMELMEPINLFSEIYKAIVDSKKRVSPQNARKKLNGMFDKGDKKRLPVVILIDELDMLCTKKQDILYDVFNWTSCEEARVSVIAIANTLDLPERVMSQRITSRLGTNRVVFQPYDYPQIEKIVRVRLSKAPHLVHELAIEFVSKKVSNVSGDLRKAMDLLRRGIEIAVEKGENDMLRFEHVNMAQKESAAAFRNVLGENLSRHGFLLFRAALCQVQSSGVEEFMFHELYKQYRILCTNLEGVNPLSDYSMHHVLMELCSNRLLVASPGTNFPRRRIRLGVLTTDALIIVKQVDDARKEGRIIFN